MRLADMLLLKHEKEMLGGLRIYAAARERLGYTPEEIVAGVTRHGAAVAELWIRPDITPVFRNRAELDSHWSGGKPDGVFGLLWLTLCTAKFKDNPADFYRAQKRLLK